MGFFFVPSISAHLRKDNPVILAFIWILGSVAGLALAMNCPVSVFSLIRQAHTARASAGVMICVVGLPLVISAVAVSMSQFWLLFPIAGLKGALYTFTGALVIQSWGSAGWLVRLLLLFGDTVSLPALICFWLSSLRTGNRELTLRFLPAASWIVLACSFDYCYVSPLLAAL